MDYRSVSLDGGEVEWGSQGLSSLFARKRNALSPGFYGMLKEMARFNREAPRLLVLDDEDPRKVFVYCAKRISLVCADGSLNAFPFSVSRFPPVFGM